MSRPSRSSIHQEKFTFGEHPRKPTIRNSWFGSTSETRGRFCDGLGGNIVVQCAVGPIIAHHGSIIASEYVDRFFLNNEAVFQDDNVPIHTAGTV
jgi:hypothetical protein